MAEINDYAPVLRVLTYGPDDDPAQIGQLLKVAVNFISTDPGSIYTVERDGGTNELIVSQGDPMSPLVTVLPPSGSVEVTALAPMGAYDLWLGYRHLGGF